MLKKNQLIKIFFRNHRLFFYGIFFCAILLVLMMLHKNNPFAPAQKNILAKKISPLKQSSLDVFAADTSIKPPFEMPAIIQPIFPNHICNLIDYGAVNDATTLNTQAFSMAIHDCARQGGGQVVVPAGKWLTGSIHLESNINLHLDKDAEIFFSPEPKNYLPAVFSRYEGVENYSYSPLIYAKDCTNIAITGAGKLIGQGNDWWRLNDFSITRKLYAMGSNAVPVENRVFDNPELLLRPAFIEFVNSDSIILEDFTIENGPMWTVHLLYSKNIAIRRINILTTGVNTDGIAIDSSKNVLIEDSNLNTGDDAITLKSGRDEDGLRVNIPTENVVVRNCKVNSGHGGISIGSEVSGGIRNVFAYNLNFYKTDNGIRIKSARGRGGIIEDIWMQNINMDKIISNAIQIDMNYDPLARPTSTAMTTIQNINLAGITCLKSKNAGIINGFSENPATEINIISSKINSRYEMRISNTRDINLSGFNIISNTKPALEIRNSQNLNISNNSNCKNIQQCAKVDSLSTVHLPFK